LSGTDRVAKIAPMPHPLLILAGVIFVAVIVLALTYRGT